MASLCLHRKWCLRLSPTAVAGSSMDCKCTGTKGPCLVYCARKGQGEQAKRPPLPTLSVPGGVLPNIRACMSRYFRKAQTPALQDTNPNTLYPDGEFAILTGDCAQSLTLVPFCLISRFPVLQEIPRRARFLASYAFGAPAESLCCGVERRARLRLRECSIPGAMTRDHRSHSWSLLHFSQRHLKTTHCNST